MEMSAVVHGRGGPGGATTGLTRVGGGVVLVTAPGPGKTRDAFAVVGVVTPVTFSAVVGTVAGGAGAVVVVDGGTVVGSGTSGAAAGD
jgi:hypothetical protein